MIDRDMYLGRFILIFFIRYARAEVAMKFVMFLKPLQLDESSTKFTGLAAARWMVMLSRRSSDCTDRRVDHFCLALICGSQRTA